MYRFILVIFGISTVFSGVCTMAYAQTDSSLMAHHSVCEGAERHGGVEACAGNDADTDVMFHTQMPCSDGSCFIYSTTQDSDTLSSGVHALLAAISLPPTLDETIAADMRTESKEQQNIDRPPPDLHFGDVRRE